MKTIGLIFLALILGLFLGCTQSTENSLPYCISPDINLSYSLAQTYVANNVTNSIVDFGSGDVVGTCNNGSEQFAKFSVINETTNRVVGVIIVKTENEIEYHDITYCDTQSDCDYRSFTGACYNTEVVNQTLKNAQENGMHIGEAPLIDGDVTCTCELNKCVTNIIK